MFTKHHLFTLFISLLILAACTGNLPEPATKFTATAVPATAIPAPVEVSTPATPIPQVEAALPAANAQPAEQSTGTWRIAGQINIPEQTMGAEFLDETFGLWVGLTGEINITTDSGLTWTRTATSSVRSEAAPEIVNKDLIWLSGMGGRVLVSKDGGQNWEFVALTPYTRHIEYLSFVDDQFGWAATTEVKRMWATDDGAQSWREIEMPSPVGEVKAILRRTAGTGYILDDTATLHITTDGGQSWSSQTIGLDMAQWTFPKRPATADLLFFDDEHGRLILSLIGAENVVMALETSDGGQTWQQEILPVGMGQLYLSHDGTVLTVTDLFDNTKITVLRSSKQQRPHPTASWPTGQHPHTAHLNVNRSPIDVNYLLYLPENFDPAQKWPLVLFLHGAGERGNDVEMLKILGLPQILENKTDFPAIVVSPQCPAGSWWPVKTKLLNALLSEIEATYPVDPQRIYATGFSMGGYGTWHLALAYPRRFAALAPVAGGYEFGRDIVPENICDLAGIPIWNFHSATDEAVPVDQSDVLVEALQQCGSKVKFTRYAKANHGETAAGAYSDPALYDWLFAQSQVD